MDPHRLAISVTSADGAVTRWGGDEPDAGRIPVGLNFSTAMPGSFATMGCTLTRDIDHPQADLTVFDRIDVYGPGGEIAWAGRQAEIPIASADNSISLNGVGLSGDLKFDPSFREIYVDRDLSHWSGPSENRRITLDSANSPNNFEPAPAWGSLVPSLRMSLNDTWASPYTPRCEAWYDAGAGIKITRLYYQWSGIVNVAFILLTGYADADDGGLAEVSADLYTTATGTYDTGPTTPRRYAAHTWVYSTTPAGVAGAENYVDLRKLMVAGASTAPLNTRTDENGADGWGVLAADVLRDVIGRAAQTVAIGEIDTSDAYVIPHLVFLDPVTAEDVILAVNAYFLYDWGVDERGFFWRPSTDYRRRWEVRKDEGATIELAGAESETAVNGVLVNFTDPIGTRRTAGPPGSNAEYTDASLGDDSDANPVNAHGIGRKWGRLDIGAVVTQDAAIKIGRTWLREALQASQRGSVSAQIIRDAETKTEWPAWMMRAGDSVRVADGDGIERRIVNTNYSHDSLAISASLDNLPHRLDAILERLSAELVGIDV